MKFSVRMRKWHKWLALIIGVQVFLWTASGLFMSFVPIETVRSEHLLKKSEDRPLVISEKYVQISKAVEVSGLNQENIGEIKIKMLLERPVFEVKTISGESKLIDAKTGELLSPLSQKLAEEIVRSRYAGDAKILKVTLLDQPISEYRSTYPVWRIDFEDKDQTSFYVSPSDGNLKAVRGNIWRVYDFLWMLHIMDYSERENFNHWWLVIAAFLAVSVTLTGFVLFFSSFRKKDFLFFK